MKIIKHYGEAKQHEKAIEEMGELVTEIKIYQEMNEDNAKERLSELADVCNMMVQLQIMWDIHGDDLMNEMDRKMQRTLERIENENK
jgi:NTP pyrophosphatase (non-canonical NTP hydrolase)